jgi:hypothetical protein
MCNCKKGRALQEVPKPQPQIIEIPKIEMVPEPQQEDWYNNIDEIKPIEDNG